MNPYHKESLPMSELAFSWLNWTKWSRTVLLRAVQSAPPDFAKTSANLHELWAKTGTDRTLSAATVYCHVWIHTHAEFSTTSIFVGQKEITWKEVLKLFQLSSGGTFINPSSALTHPRDSDSRIKLGTCATKSTTEDLEAEFCCYLNEMYNMASNNLDCFFFSLVLMAFGTMYLSSFSERPLWRSKDWTGSILPAFGLIFVVKLGHLFNKNRL